MTPSEKVTETIIQFETFRDKSYINNNGWWACGYGHTYRVGPLTTCTKEQALTWLENDIKNAASEVNRLVKAPLTQNQFDSLVVFVFNVGVKDFAYSCLLRKLNAKNYECIPSELQRWIYSGGKKLNDLIHRRRAEAAWFKS